MSFSKPQISFSSNFASFFSVMKNNFSGLECSSQNSPNSCRFWNNKTSFEFSINPKCHETWIYYTVLAEILYILNKRSLSKYRFGEISCEQRKVWNFTLWWVPFIQIIYILNHIEYWPKKYEELSPMTLKGDAKFKEKLTCGFKYDMRNLMNFHPTTQTSKNFTSMGYFCPKCTRFELKSTEELSFMTLNSDAKFE